MPIYLYGDMLALPEGTVVRDHQGLVWTREAQSLVHRTLFGHRQVIDLAREAHGFVPWAPFTLSHEVAASVDRSAPRGATPMPGETWERIDVPDEFVRVDVVYTDFMRVACVAYNPVGVNEDAHVASTVEEFTGLYAPSA